MRSRQRCGPTRNSRHRWFTPSVVLNLNCTVNLPLDRQLLQMHLTVLLLWSFERYVISTKHDAALYIPLDSYPRRLPRLIFLTKARINKHSDRLRHSERRLLHYRFDHSEGMLFTLWGCWHLDLRQPMRFMRPRNGRKFESFVCTSVFARSLSWRSAEYFFLFRCSLYESE